MKMNGLLLVIALNKDWHGSWHCMELNFYMTNNKTFKPFLESKLFPLSPRGKQVLIQGHRSLVEYAFTYL
jgi:hypothetical protein